MMLVSIKQYKHRVKLHKNIHDNKANLEFLPWKHGKQWASAGLTVRQT
jgi:hypothetical protein